MAQTIKLKRSGTSGAIPTTSQLELGEVAINTYDGKMYIKKNVGGTESIVEVTVAAADAIVVEYQFTATANQTTFSGSDDNSETLSYSAGAVQIFLNGILLDSGVDYTATNGTSIVLSEVVDANDYLQVFAFKKKISNGQTTVDTFTGNGSTTAFTLSLDPGDENNTRVYVDGVYQSKSNYSVSGTTLTFSTAPPADTAIEVEIGNRVVTLDTASNLDLPDNVRLRLGTGQDMQLYHDGSNSYLLGTGGSGSLLTRADLFAVQDSSNINMIQASSSTGQVSLYYNTGSTSAIKLRTTSTGVTVTGNIANSSGDMALDVAGDIILDADGGDVRLKDNGTEFLNFYAGTIERTGSLTFDVSGNITLNADGSTISLNDDTINFGQFYQNASGQLNIYAPTQDKDIVFLGNDGGSTITALTLDMSNAGEASFNDDINLGDGKRLRMGAGGDFEIFHDGSHNYIKGASSDQDLIFQGVDGGSAITALRLDMSAAGAATFNAGSTFSGNLSITAGSGQRYIEIASGTSNAKTYRIYNGISWNSDALLIYNHTDDNTVLTIEPGKLGINRGANSLSHTLDVGGNIAISGTEIVTTSRTITNIGSLTVTGTNANLTLGSSGNNITFGRNGDNYIDAQAGTSSNIVINPENRFVVNTSDTERMRIDSTGKTKIMTSTSSVAAAHSAADELQIIGDGVVSGITISNVSDAGTGTLFFGDTSSATAAGIRYNHNTGDMAISAEDFITMDTDRLGVRTTAPEKNISIGSSQADGIQFNYDGTNNYRNQILNYWNSATDTRMDFNIGPSSGGTPATIMSVGYGNNVGIGTTSPSQPMQINPPGGGYNLFFGRGNSVPGSSDPWLGLFNATTIGPATYGWGFYDSNSDGSLQIWNRNNSTTGAVALTIKRGGDVGIGTSSPDYRLHMERGDGSDNVFAIQNTSAARLSEIALVDENDVKQVRYYYDNGGNRSYQHVNGNGLTVYSSQSSAEIARFGLASSGYTASYFNGNVGIGTDSPTDSTNLKTLDIRGTNGGQLLLGRSSQWDFFAFSSSSSTSIGTYTGQALIFRTNSNGGNNERMRINSDGTIDLATTTAPSGQSLFATAAYASGQGDNRTHLGYNTGSGYYNYIRGANTVISGPSQFDNPATFNSYATFAANSRPVVINGGAITMQGDTGGWAFGLHALGSSNTNHGGFGFLGGADSLSYYYIGEAYNASNNFRFYKNGTLQVGSTTILDSSKNITNINTATISGSTSVLLTLNPTANNYGGIAFQYGGSTKGFSIYNAGAMVYGGESGVHTYLQAGGQYGLAIRASDRNVSIGSTSSFPQKLYVNGNIRADGHYYVGGLAVIDSSRNVANVASVTIDNNNDDYNFKAKAGDSDSWFGVYDDANNSANIIVTRSDTTESFKHMGHTGETVIKANGTGLRIESTDNEAIQISGNGGGINFQTGSNQRIYFNSYRAMEGNNNGTSLQIAEGYSLVNLQANMSVHGNITPSANNTYDLGSSSQVWRDLYIGDLNLNNETRVNDDGTTGNEIDGTTGNWTVQEGEEHLYLINNKNGKKYKFCLEEIE